jgi:hypothetical protein
VTPGLDLAVISHSHEVELVLFWCSTERDLMSLGALNLPIWDTATDKVMATLLKMKCPATSAKCPGLGHREFR